MFQIGLDDLAEEHLQGLIGTPESYVLEFKRELDLSTPLKRMEAAKDVAALANSQGGRLLYGIAEKRLSSGLQVAEALLPLQDAGLAARLENIISDCIHPSPHRRLRNVAVANGFILVVEVYPSLGRDLHMTQDHRFYRRSETRITKMSEPEVREAYSRLVISSQALEQALNSTVADQLKQAPNYGRVGQSVLIIPWYARRNLADPRSLVGIGRDLADGPFQDYRSHVSSQHWEAIANLEVSGDGLRSTARLRSFRFLISRLGVVHLADSEIFLQTEFATSEPPYLMSSSVIRNMIVGLGAARLTLERCNYWGPVQVVSVITVPTGTRVVVYTNNVHPRPLTNARIELAVAEVNLSERGTDLEPVAREMADQLFQHLGEAKCPYFAEDGHLLAAIKPLLREP